MCVLVCVCVLSTIMLSQHIDCVSCAETSSSANLTSVNGDKQTLPICHSVSVDCVALIHSSRQPTLGFEGFPKRNTVITTGTFQTLLFVLIPPTIETQKMNP